MSIGIEGSKLCGGKGAGAMDGALGSLVSDTVNSRPAFSAKGNHPIITYRGAIHIQYIYQSKSRHLVCLIVRIKYIQSIVLAFKHCI